MLSPIGALVARSLLFFLRLTVALLLAVGVAIEYVVYHKPALSYRLFLKDLLGWITD